MKEAKKVSWLHQTHQIAQLKSHLISIGGQRRKYYENSYIHFHDELDENDFNESTLNGSDNEDQVTVSLKPILN